MCIRDSVGPAAGAALGRRPRAAAPAAAPAVAEGDGALVAFNEHTTKGTNTLHRRYTVARADKATAEARGSRTGLGSM